MVEGAGCELVELEAGRVVDDAVIWDEVVRVISVEELPPDVREQRYSCQQAFLQQFQRP